MGISRFVPEPFDYIVYEHLSDQVPEHYHKVIITQQ
jgi:hypothetical protein